MDRIRIFLWGSVVLNILLVIVVILTTCPHNDGINMKVSECLKGWTKSLESLHDTVDVVFFGNSITHQGPFDNTFSELKICNLGYPSDDLIGMKERIRQITVLHPRMVFVMGGVNGLTDKTIWQFKEEYDSLVQNMVFNLPDTQIFLESILPVNKGIKNYNVPEARKIQQANSIIQSISEKYKCIYIDLYSLYSEDGVLPPRFTEDGVHLKEEAYTIWIEKIKSYIYE